MSYRCTSHHIRSGVRLPRSVSACVGRAGGDCAMAVNEDAATAIHKIDFLIRAVIYKNYPYHAVFRLILPRRVPLKGQNENDRPDDPRNSNKILTVHRDLVINKKYLRQDKTQRKDNKDNFANEFFRLAHQKAQYRNKREE
jgi:hypothetical protein